MGLDSSSLKFLCGVKSKGVDFSKVATIGRQSFLPDARAALKEVLSVLGVHGDADELMRDRVYGEFFFELLGAKEIMSVDVSSYEDATIIHDMNRPIPDEFRRRFTLVYDGGSLEHIFNFPQALANCMDMVEVGGYFAQVTMANNFMGHGFWQISPELIFRAFSPINGYRVEAVLLNEPWGGPWHVVRDPEEMRCRVELNNSHQTFIFSVAQRIATAEIFATMPQQSDYVAVWDRGWGGQQQHTGLVDRLRPLKKYVPHGAKWALKAMLKSPYSSSAYRRISEADLLRGRWA